MVIPTRKEAINLSGVIRRMPSHVDEFVIAGGRSHDHTVDVARAREIGRFLSPLQHDYDFAKGSRYGAGGGSKDLTWWRNAGSRALTRVAQIVYRCDYGSLTSPQSS
ncbi:hypothetical protein AB4Y67_16090 [Arthrobacter sp. YAF17]|uniref:hypothetical protein n=1 Tax=Arthrobacter sp. YAF17 TaxID=3233077 RepID=UPI003F90ABA3